MVNPLNDQNLQDARSEKPFRSRFSLFFRSLSAFIILAFLLQDFASAQGGTPLWTEVTPSRSATSGAPRSSLDAITIPDSAGLTRKVVAKGSSDVIINIQDAHSKLGAQESITEILDNLVRNYNLSLIALEGASEKVDTSLVSSFPIEEVREKTGKYLLKEGKISAGEFYSMISKEPVKLYGVDDPELYKGNLDVFRSLVDNKLLIRNELRSLNKVLEDLEKAVYSPELMELSDKKLLQKNGEIKFTEYWERFSKIAQDNGVDYGKYLNLKKLADTVELEKGIDFKKAQKQRDTLIEELGRKLPKPELEKLVLQSLQFKQGKITPGAFHYYLSRISQGTGMDPAQYTDLILYAKYVVLYEDIDLVAIFDEVESFESELREKLFRSEDERAISNLSHCARILSQLLDTTLTDKDYEFFVKNSSSCDVEDIRTSLQALAAKHHVAFEGRVNFDVLSKNIPDAKEFYRLAEARNKALLANTMKRMQEENTHVAALITGGFHSEGIAKLMDSEKLSYLVVMPKFDDKSPNRPYIAILTQKPREYEKAFEDSDFYIAAASIFAKNFPDSEPEQLDAVAANLAGARLSVGDITEVQKKFAEALLTGGKELWAKRVQDAQVGKSEGGYVVTIDGKRIFVRFSSNGSLESVTRLGSSEKELANVNPEDLARLQKQIDDLQKQLGMLSETVSRPAVADETFAEWLAQAMHNASEAYRRDAKTMPLDALTAVLVSFIEDNLQNRSRRSMKSLPQGAEDQIAAAGARLAAELKDITTLERSIAATGRSPRTSSQEVKTEAPAQIEMVKSEVSGARLGAEQAPVELPSLGVGVSADRADAEQMAQDAGARLAASAKPSFEEYGRFKSFYPSIFALMEKIDLKDRVVLDLGAGEGALTQRALESGARRVVAVEIDPKSAAAAFIKLSNTSVGGKKLKGRIITSPFDPSVEADDDFIIVNMDMMDWIDQAKTTRETKERLLGLRKSERVIQISNLQPDILPGAVVLGLVRADIANNEGLLSDAIAGGFFTDEKGAFGNHGTAEEKSRLDSMGLSYEVHETTGANGVKAEALWVRRTAGARLAEAGEVPKEAESPKAKPVINWKNGLFYAGLSVLALGLFAAGLAVFAAAAMTLPIWLGFAGVSAALTLYLAYRGSKWAPVKGAVKDPLEQTQLEDMLSGLNSAVSFSVKARITLKAHQLMNEANAKAVQSHEEDRFKQETKKPRILISIGAAVLAALAAALAISLAVTAGTAVTAVVVLGALAVNAGWILAAGLVAYLLVFYVFSEVFYSFNDSKGKAWYVRLGSIPWGLGNGVIALAWGLPYHIFKGFVGATFEKKFKTYAYSLFTYIFQDGKTRKKFIDHYVNISLSWVSREEIKEIIEYEKNLVSENKKTSIGALKFSGKLIFETTPASAIVEIVKTRWTVFAAGAIAHYVLPLVAVNLFLFPIVGLAIVLFMMFRQSPTLLKAFRGRDWKTIGKIALLDVFIATILIFLFINGFHTTPDGSYFNVLQEGWVVHAPGIGPVAATPLEFTVESIGRSAATMAVLSLKDAGTTARVKFLLSLDEYLAKALTTDRHRELLEATGRKVIVSSISMDSIKAILEAKKEDGSALLTDGEDAMLRAVFARVLTARNIAFWGLKGVSGFDTKLILSYLGKTQDSALPLGFSKWEKQSGLPLILASLGETVTSAAYWKKVGVGTPGMWFIGTELHYIVGLADATGFTPLVVAVHAVEGDIKEQQRLAMLQAQGHDVSAFERARAGGILGLGQSTVNLFSEGVNGVIAALVAPPASARQVSAPAAPPASTVTTPQAPPTETRGPVETPVTPRPAPAVSPTVIEAPADTGNDILNIAMRLVGDVGRYRAERVDPDTRYAALIDRLWLNADGSAPSHIIYSIEPNTIFAPLREFRSVTDFNDFRGSPGVTVVTYEALSSDIHPADLARITQDTSKFRQLGPGETRDPSRTYYDLFTWTEGGVVRSGLVESGRNASEQNLQMNTMSETSQALVDEMNRILSISDPVRQAEEINSSPILAQYNIHVEPGSTSFAVADFEYEEGTQNIVGVRGFYRYDDLRPAVVDGRTVFVLERDGRREVLTHVNNFQGNNNYAFSYTLPAQPAEVIAPQPEVPDDVRPTLDQLPPVVEPGLRRVGGVIMGTNYLRAELISAELNVAQTRRDAMDAHEQARFLRHSMFLEAILAFVPQAAPVAHLVHSLADPAGQTAQVASRDDLLEAMAEFYAIEEREQAANTTFEGPALQEELERVRAEWAANPVAKQAAIVAAQSRLDQTFSTDARERFLSYAERRRREGNITYALGLIQQVVSVAGVQGVPSLTGDVPLGSGGQVGFSVNVQSVANAALTGLSRDRNVMTRQASVNAPNVPRISAFFRGFPVFLIFAQDFAHRVDVAYHDRGTYAFRVRNGFLTDRLYTYNEENFRMLQRVPIGVYEDGTGVQRPVYAVRDGNQWEVVILTIAGSEDMAAEAARDVVEVQRAAEIHEQGGVSVDVSAQLGTLNQRNESGLFASFDFERPDSGVRAYTWDNALAVFYGMASGDMEMARGILDRYVAYIAAQPRFQGLPRALNASDAGAISDQTPSVAVTAAIGQMMLYYQTRTGDTRYQATIIQIAGWLEDHRVSGGLVRDSETDSNVYAEPNAVVSAFFSQYGETNLRNHARFARYAVRGREAAWRTLWDPSVQMFRAGNSTTEFSADAQTRSLVVYGPQQFIGRLGLDGYAQYLHRIDERFGVTETRGSASFHMLDMVDQDSQIRSQRGPRVFPEVTSEFVRALEEAGRAFRAAGEAYTRQGDLVSARAASEQAEWAFARAAFYQGELDRMRTQRGLPQTLTATDTGFNGRSAEGQVHLGATLQDRLTFLGYNIFTFERNSGAAVPQASRGPLVTGDTMTRRIYSVGPQSVTEAQTLLAELRRSAPDRLLFVNENGLEYVYVDEQGLQRHVLINPTPDMRREHAELLERQAQDGRDHDQALRVGGVELKTLDGQPILDNGHKVRVGAEQLTEILRWIARQPQDVRARIDRLNYSGFEYPYDVDGDGQIEAGEKVLVNLTIPRNFAYTAQDPTNDNVETRFIYQNGRLRRSITAGTITSYTYDSETNIRSGSEVRLNITRSLTLPIPGGVIYETHGLEAYLDVLNNPDAPGTEPRFVVFEVDRRSGDRKINIYGASDRPLVSINLTTNTVTYISYASDGLTSSRTFRIANADEFQAALRQGRYLAPVNGSLVSSERTLRLETRGGRRIQIVEVTGADRSKKIEWRDLSHSGRLIRSRSGGVTYTYEYQERFMGGNVAWRITADNNEVWTAVRGNAGTHRILYRVDSPSGTRYELTQPIGNSIRVTHQEGTNLYYAAERELSGRVGDRVAIRQLDWNTLNVRSNGPIQSYVERAAPITYGTETLSAIDILDSRGRLIETQVMGSGDLHGRIAMGQISLTRPARDISGTAVYEADFDAQQRFAGENTYRFDARTRTVDTSVIISYSVQQRVQDLFQTLPSGLENVTQASAVFERNPRTGEYRWRETLLFEASGQHPVGSLAPDPLYLGMASDPRHSGSARMMVVNIHEFDNSADRAQGFIRTTKTYAYRSGTVREQVGQAEWITDRAAIRGIIDIDSVASFASEDRRLQARRLEVQRILRDPDVRLYRVEDFRRDRREYINDPDTGRPVYIGTEWYSFFDSEHGSQPVARIEGHGGTGGINDQRQLHVSTFFDEWSQDPANMESLRAQSVDPATLANNEVMQEQVFVMDGNRVTRLAARAERNLEAQRHLPELDRQLQLIGYSNLHGSLGIMQVFTIQTIGNDERTVTKTDTVGYFNMYQQLVKIDSFRHRIALSYFDPSHPWVELGGIDYEFTGSAENPRIAGIERLERDPRASGPDPVGLSLVLNPGEQYRRDERGRYVLADKRVFVFNTAGITGSIEERDQVDGVVNARIDGFFRQNRPDINEIRRLRDLYGSETDRETHEDWQTKARGLTFDRWESTSRTVNQYNSFTNYDGIALEPVYLRILGVPSSANTYLMDSNTRNFSSRSSSQSQLGAISFQQANPSRGIDGMRIEILRADTIYRDSVERIRQGFTGDQSYQSRPIRGNIVRHSVEVRNEHGFRLETWFGDVVGPPTDDMTVRYRNFIPRRKIYEFYSSTNNRGVLYGIPDASAGTVVINGQELLNSLARNALIGRTEKRALDNGLIVTNVINGRTDSPPVVRTMLSARAQVRDRHTTYASIRARALNENLENVRPGTQNTPFHMDTVLGYRSEVIDQGRLFAIMSGYEPGDIGSDGFPTQSARARYVEFMNYGPGYYQLFHVGLPTVSYTMERREGSSSGLDGLAQSLDISRYMTFNGTVWEPRESLFQAGREGYLRRTQLRDILMSPSAAGDGSGETAMATYRVEDFRPGGVGRVNAGTTLDGTLRYEGVISLSGQDVSMRHQGTQYDIFGTPLYITARPDDNPDTPQLLYARIRTWPDRQRDGYLWVYREPVDKSISPTLSVYFGGTELLRWVDLAAGGVNPNNASYMPSTANSMADRHIVLPIMEALGSDDWRLYLEQRKNEFRADPNSPLNQVMGDENIPNELVQRTRAEGVRVKPWQENPVAVAASIYAGGLGILSIVLIFLFGSNKKKKTAPAESVNDLAKYDDEAYLNREPSFESAVSMDSNTITGMASLGVEAFIHGLEQRAGEAKQTRELIAVLKSLKAKGILNDGHMSAAALKLGVKAKQTDVETAPLYLFHELLMEEVFRGTIDQAFDDIDPSGEVVKEKQRNEIRSKILEQLLVNLNIDPEFIKDSNLNIRRIENELRDKNKFLETDPEGVTTPDHLKAWVWRETYSLPIGLTGFLGEMAGRSRLMDFLIRRTDELSRRDEDKKHIIPFVRAYAKFWRMIIQDQGQTRGNPNGKLLMLRALTTEKFAWKPVDLFLNMHIDDLYRYYQNPVAQLKDEIDSVFPGALPAGDLTDTEKETAYMNALNQHLSGIARLTADDLDITKKGKFKTKEEKEEERQRIQESDLYQQLAKVFGTAVNRRIDPTLAKWMDRTGLRALSQAFLMMPFHTTSHGWEAFFLSWGNAEMAERIRGAEGKGIRAVLGTIAIGVLSFILIPFQKNLHGSERPKGSSGYTTGQTSYFWFMNFAAWAGYIGGLGWVLFTFLQGYSQLIGMGSVAFHILPFFGVAGLIILLGILSFRAKTPLMRGAYLLGGAVLLVGLFLYLGPAMIFAWTSSSILYALFAIVTIPAIFNIGVGLVAIIQGNNNRVAAVRGAWWLPALYMAVAAGLFFLMGMTGLIYFSLGFLALESVIKLIESVTGLLTGRSVSIRPPDWNIWGHLRAWPRGNMLWLYSKNQSQVEPVTGKTYKMLLWDISDALYARNELSESEWIGLKKGEFTPVKSIIARDYIRQFFNNIYIKKADLESWASLMSLTQMVSASNDAKFYYAWDEQTAVGSQDGKLTKLYYLTTRKVYKGEWRNLIDLLNKKYTGDAAKALIKELANLKPNAPPSVLDPNDAEVKAIQKAVELWFNRRQYDNFRLMESLRLVGMKSYLDYAQNWFYDEKFQELKKRFIGRRIYKGAGASQKMNEDLNDVFSTTVDEFEFHNELLKLEKSGELDADQEIYLRKSKFYMAEMKKKIQVILREDGLSGVTNMDNEGNITSMDIVDTLKKAIANAESVDGTTHVNPMDPLKDTKFSFNSIAGNSESYIAVIQGVLSRIRSGFGGPLRELIKSGNFQNKAEILKELENQEQRLNLSLNDHLSNLYETAIVDYRFFVEELLRADGLTIDEWAGVTGGDMPALVAHLKNLAPFDSQQAPDPLKGQSDVEIYIAMSAAGNNMDNVLKPAKTIMQNLTKFRDYAKAEDYLESNGMTFFKASKADVLEGCKYGGWGRAMYAVRGHVLQGIDSLQEVPVVYGPSLVRAMTEFSRNPLLALLLNGIQGNTENFSSVSNGAFFSESTWNTAGQRAKEAIDSLGAYGKFHTRVDFLMRYEGLQTDLVSEDILTALQFIVFGFRIKYIEYFQMGWRTAANLFIYLTPSGIKYPSGLVEFQGVFSRVFMRMMLNPNVPTAFKLGFMLNAWFYYKKPIVVLTIIAFAVFSMVLKWNLFLALPLPVLWTLIGVVLAETINITAFARYWERDGLIRGTINSIGMIFKHMKMFLPNLPMNARGIYVGTKANSEFIQTSKAGDIIGDFAEGDLKIGEANYKTKIYGRKRFIDPKRGIYNEKSYKWSTVLGTVLLTALVIWNPLSWPVFVNFGIYILGVFFWSTTPYLFAEGPELWGGMYRVKIAGIELPLGKLAYPGIVLLAALAILHPYILAFIGAYVAVPFVWNALTSLGILAALLLIPPYSRVTRNVFRTPVSLSWETLKAAYSKIRGIWSAVRSKTVPASSGGPRTPGVSTGARLASAPEEILRVEKQLRLLMADPSTGLTEEKLQHALALLKSGQVSTLVDMDVIKIVDGKEVVIGQVDGPIGHQLGLLHRTSNALVVTPEGRFLIQRRAHNVFEPLKVSIYGGHVLVGKSYRDAIESELVEEMGLPEGYKLQGRLDLVGEEGQFTSSESDPLNNERRALYIYHATESELQAVRAQKELIRQAKAKRDLQGFMDWMEAEKSKGEGLGEVWDVYELTKDELFRLIDPTSSLVLNETFSTGDVEAKLEPTPDLLGSLLKDPAFIKAVDEVSSGARLTQNNIQLGSNIDIHQNIQVYPNISITGPDAFARGEGYVLNIGTGSSLMPVQRYSKDVMGRDHFSDPLQFNDTRSGFPISEYVRQESLGAPDYIPGILKANSSLVELAVNSTQGHFFDRPTIIIQDGEVITKPVNRYVHTQKVDYELEGVYWILSLDPEKPGIFPVTMRNGKVEGDVPVRNGFGGPLLIQNGQSRVNDLKTLSDIPQRDPERNIALLGDEVGWATIDKRQAFTGFGYDASRRLVIIQLIGDPNEPSRPEPTVYDLVAVLRSLGVEDAILGGTSGDVQRHTKVPVNGQVLRFAEPQTNSTLARLVTNPRTGQRNVGTALLFVDRPVSGARLAASDAVPTLEQEIKRVLAVKTNADRMNDAMKILTAALRKAPRPSDLSWEKAESLAYLIFNEMPMDPAKIKETADPDIAQLKHLYDIAADRRAAGPSANTAIRVEISGDQFAAAETALRSSLGSMASNFDFQPVTGELEPGTITHDMVRVDWNTATDVSAVAGNLLDIQAHLQREQAVAAKRIRSVLSGAMSEAEAMEGMRMELAELAAEFPIIEKVRLYRSDSALFIGTGGKLFTADAAGISAGITQVLEDGASSDAKVSGLRSVLSQAVRLLGLSKDKASFSATFAVIVEAVRSAVLSPYRAVLATYKDVAGNYTMVISAKTYRRDPAGVRKEIQENRLKVPNARFHLVLAVEDGQDEPFSDAEIKDGGFERVINVGAEKNLSYLITPEDVLFNKPVIVLAEQGGLYIQKGGEEKTKALTLQVVTGSEGAIGTATAAMALILSQGQAILPHVTRTVDGLFIIEPLSAMLNGFLKMIEMQQQTVGAAA